MLENLLDNAYQHGAAGSTPLVAGGSDEHGVWLTVSNEGNVVDLTRKGRLFEPFTQVDSGATREREGIGVGLYVVRRLVEVYGGSVDVRSDSGWVTVDVRLKGWTANPARELQNLSVIAELEDAYAAAVAVHEVGELPTAAVEAGWLLEELRVSLFAQSLGTSQSVSAKRVRTAIAGLARG